MKKSGTFIISIVFFLSGCGRNDRPETVREADVVSSSAPLAIVQSESAMSFETEVIVYGEESVPEPVITTLLEKLLAATENCDSLSDLHKALSNSTDPVADLALLCREAGGNLSLLAAEALGRMGTPEATIELISLVSDLPRGRLKTDVIDVASKLNSTECTPILFEALRVTHDDDVLWVSQQALANIADSNVVCQIVDRYAEADEYGQGVLSEVLRYVENENAVGALIDLMDSSDSLSDPLTLAAIDALGTLGTEEAVSALFQRLEATKNRSDAEVLVRSIGRITNEEALKVLQQMAQSGGDGAFSSSTAALKALLNFSGSAR